MEQKNDFFEKLFNINSTPKINFDEPIFLPNAEAAKLKINKFGISELYPDSYFEFKFVPTKGLPGYNLTRRRLDYSLSPDEPTSNATLIQKVDR